MKKYVAMPMKASGHQPHGGVAAAMQRPANAHGAAIFSRARALMRGATLGARDPR